MRLKVNKYTTKVHLKEWIDRMYMFKNEALRDHILDQKEIELWNVLLNEYAQSDKSNNNLRAPADQAHNSEPNISKELKRLQELMSLLVIKLNGDSRSEPTSTLHALPQT